MQAAARNEARCSQTADQLLGLLFAGTGLGYFVSRLRGIA